MNLDEVLPQLGDFGRYQFLLILFVVIPCSLPNSIISYQEIFATLTLPFWCKVPELDSLDPEQRINLGIPKMEDNRTWDQCKRYSVDWSKINIKSSKADPSWETESCKDGFEYDTSEITATIVTKFDLVCDDDNKVHIGLCVLNCGNLCGMIIFGFLTDKYGRKKTYFMIVTTILIGNILTLTCVNYWMWLVAKFISGSTIIASFQAPFILGLEFVSPKYRSLVILLTCICYAVGLIALTGIAYFVRDWFYLTLITTIPFACYYLFWFCLPDSPRWLLLKGRTEEAYKILETIARVNKAQPPGGTRAFLENTMSKVPAQSRTSKRNTPNIGDLFTSPNMRTIYLLIIFNLFIILNMFTQINYLAPFLVSNIHMAMALVAAVEIPSYIIMHFTMNTFGRRIITFITCLFASISGLIIVGLPKDEKNALLGVFIVFKFMSSIVTGAFYLYAGELIPTELRGFGIGLATGIGAIGICVIPYIDYLGKDNLKIPAAVLGTLLLIASFSVLRLPETLNQPLPENVEDAENFGKTRTATDCLKCVFFCFKRSSNLPNAPD